MNDLTTEELGTLVSVFQRAGVELGQGEEGELYARIQTLHAERVELESLDFDDCAGGACKL